MTLKIKSDALQSINPRNGEAIGEFASTPIDEIPAIIQKVQTASENWSNLSLKTRLELGKKAYRQFYFYQDEVAQIISAETGKPLAEAYSSEILPVLDCFKYYLKNTPKIIRDQPIRSGNPIFKLRKGFVRYEPLGVILVISPWNYPFLLAMQHIVPAILAGNVVIHKPSEQTTLTGLNIREIFDRAYLPKGVLEIVTGLGDVGQALVNSKVDKIIFTGSTAVGKKIYQSAAKNLVPVSMELGGNDCMIVLEDAPVERAVNGALWGAFCNAGQACLSVERLYVQEAIYETFVRMLVEKAGKIRLNSKNGTGDISCLINEAQFEKVRRLAENARQKGASVVAGGKPRQELGAWFFEPTILTNVDRSMDVMQEEIFGPLLTVTPFSTEEEAVTLANGTEYGLAASIWTQNRKRGLALAEKLQAGSVMINDLLIHIAQMEAPYNGHKNSGLGVTHGPWGVMEVMQPKFINTDRPLLRRFLSLFARRLVNNDIWWFNYSENAVNRFKVFTDFLHGHGLWKRLRSLPAVVKAVFRNDYL